MRRTRRHRRKQMNHRRSRCEVSRPAIKSHNHQEDQHAWLMVLIARASASRCGRPLGPRSQPLRCKAQAWSSFSS
eukprot:5679273-Prymnesium_polylepis.1